MLTVSIHLVAAIRGCLAFRMPTNRMIDWLHSQRGLKRAIPIAFFATSAYFVAMGACAAVVERGGPGYLNLLVMLFAWNALKFALTGILMPALWVRPLRTPADRRNA